MDEQLLKAGDADIDGKLNHLLAMACKFCEFAVFFLFFLPSIHIF